MGRSEALSSAAIVILLSSIVTSEGKWTGDPSVSKDSLTFRWDDTGVDNSFVRYVVELYTSRNHNRRCNDVYRPPKRREIPVYVLREATFTGLHPGGEYCRNCTIVTTNGNKSCGEYGPYTTVRINSTDQTERSFNSTWVTNTSIAVSWPSFAQQNSKQSSYWSVQYFYYYKVDISPRETETKTPLLFFNETETEATFTALIPGKEYQVHLMSVGMDSREVLRNKSIPFNMMEYNTAAIVATDPSPVERVSVIAIDSTSVTLNLEPPKEGFVDLFQVQATSLHHSSPLIDVPFPGRPRSSVRTTLSNLQPETPYKISATAVANGKRSQTKFATIRTQAVSVNIKVVGSATAAGVVVLIVAGFATVRIVKRLKYKLHPAQLFKEVLEDIVGSEKMEPWLKKRNDVFLEELIGEGEFGHVRKGVLREKGQQAVIVAAKTLRVDRANETTYRDFAKEASLLIEVNNNGGHLNIVSLIGLVVDGERKKDPSYILVEYAEPGELLWYLVSVQNNRYQADFPPGLGRQLTEVAIDIARGMLELKRRRITHRDLACRNIVLSSPDGQAGRLVAKISDFGLARDVYVTTQYMRHPITNILLPIKWMAIESLIEGVYSCKSDMWGFGVVLWEIATLGGTPYPEVLGYETLVTRLRRGYRLQKPNGCSDELYELMNICWLDDPDARPTPDVIEERLDHLLQQDMAFFPET